MSLAVYCLFLYIFWFIRSFVDPTLTVFVVCVPCSFWILSQIDLICKIWHAGEGDSGTPETLLGALPWIQFKILTYRMSRILYQYWEVLVLVFSFSKQTLKKLLQLTHYFAAVNTFRENIFISEIFWHPLNSRVPWSIRQTCFCYHQRISKVYQRICSCAKPFNTFKYDVKPSFLRYHTSSRNLEQEIIQRKKCCLIFGVLSILASGMFDGRSQKRCHIV